MVRLRHTEDLSLPRSARSYIDSCATEFYDTDDNTKIAEIAYRLKRGADLLSIFIEDIRRHMGLLLMELMKTLPEAALQVI